MNREGAWALFWATGLPEAWLATRDAPKPEETQAAIACAAPTEEADGL